MKHNSPQYSISKEHRIIFNFEEDTPEPSTEDEDLRDLINGETSTPAPDTADEREKPRNKEKPVSGIKAIETHLQEYQQKVQDSFDLESELNQPQDIASLTEALSSYAIMVDEAMPMVLDENWDRTVGTLINSPQYEDAKQSIIESIQAIAETDFVSAKNINISFEGFPDSDQGPDKPTITLEITGQSGKKFNIEIDPNESKEALQDSINLANLESTLSDNGIRIREINPANNKTEIEAEIFTDHPDKRLRLTIDNQGKITNAALSGGSDCDDVCKETIDTALNNLKGKKIEDIFGKSLNDLRDAAMLDTAERKINGKPTTAPQSATKAARSRPQRPAPKPRSQSKPQSSPSPTAPKQPPPAQTPPAAEAPVPTPTEPAPVAPDATPTATVTPTQTTIPPNTPATTPPAQPTAAPTVQPPQAPSAAPSGQKYEITEGEEEEENEFAALIRTAGIYLGAIIEDIHSYQIDKTATTKLNARLALPEPLSYEEKKTFALAKYGFDVKMTPAQLEVFQEKVKIDRFLGGDPSKFFTEPAKYQEFIKDPSKVPIRDFLDTKKLYSHFQGIRDEVKGSEESGPIDTHPKNQALEELFLSIILTKNVKDGPQPLLAEGVTKYLDRILQTDPYLGPDGKPLTGTALEDKKKSIEGTNGRQPFYPFMNFSDYEKHTQGKTQIETAERIASRSLNLDTLNPSSAIELTPNVARVLMTMNATDFMGFQHRSAAEDSGSQGRANFAAVKKLSIDFNNRIANGNIKLPEKWENMHTGEGINRRSMLNVSQLFGKTGYIDKISSSTSTKKDPQERIFNPLPNNSDTNFAKLREETPIDVLIKDIENMPADTFQTLFALTPAQLLDFALDGKLNPTDTTKGEPEILKGKTSEAPIPKSIARYLVIKYMEANNLTGQPLSKFEEASKAIPSVQKMVLDFSSNTYFQAIFKPIEAIAAQTYSTTDGKGASIKPYGEMFANMIKVVNPTADNSDLSPLLISQDFHYLAASLDPDYDPITKTRKSEEKPPEVASPTEATKAAPDSEAPTEKFDE